MLNAKVVTAGPRGNACRKCKEKVKKPDVLLRVSTFNRHTKFMKVDNYCSGCAVEHVEKGLTTLKGMLRTLIDGPKTDSELGSTTVRNA